MKTKTKPPKAKAVKARLYRPLYQGKLRTTDQCLFADYRMDCEAKLRWHNVRSYVGHDVEKYLRRHPHLRFRRLRSLGLLTTKHPTP